MFYVELYLVIAGPRNGQQSIFRIRNAMNTIKRIILSICCITLLSACAGTTAPSIPNPDVMTQQDVQAQNEAKLEAATRY